MNTSPHIAGIFIRRRTHGGEGCKKMGAEVGMTISASQATTSIAGCHQNLGESHGNDSPSEILERTNSVNTLISDFWLPEYISVALSHLVWRLCLGSPGNRYAGQVLLSVWVLIIWEVSVCENSESRTFMSSALSSCIRYSNKKVKISTQSICLDEVKEKVFCWAQLTEGISFLCDHFLYMCFGREHMGKWYIRKWSKEKRAEKGCVERTHIPANTSF